MPPKKPRTPQVTERSHLPFPVVGIGASAGGLVALQGFLANVPAGPGMAFVVVLHLSPRHESNLATILQRSTSMPVVQVAGDIPIRPDHVYVIPPRCELTMNDGHLCVQPGERLHGPHVAIDVFVRTLAEAHRERAFGVVLSGTGADGTVGLARLKECGGVTLAQVQQEAEYEDMPRNAIASGHVDLVSPVAEMPRVLLDIWNNARQIALPDPGPDAEPLPVATDHDATAETALREVIAMLAARTGHDFSHYKRATMLRRMERRMQVRMLKDLPAYRDYVRQHPSETEALLGDMLISVTNFFRDRESFDALARDVAPQLVSARTSPDEIRAWSVGCATGEEAYSLAMVLRDEIDRQESPVGLQVFGTDIDDHAIAIARAGRFPLSIAADVPAAALEAHFIREDGHYRIRKRIRERVLFAPHNVLRDPPFSRLDLVSCRNVLIYLNRDIQERLLDMFHFALRPGGILFLGNSESADAADELFEVVDKKHRIYRARATAASRRTPSLPLRVVAPRAPALVAPRTARSDGPTLAELHHRVLEQYAAPSVVVDADYNLLHMSDRAGVYLQHVGGVPSHNLLALVRDELRMELRGALYQAMQAGHSVEARRVRLPIDGQPRIVNMIVRPFSDGGSAARYALVLFAEVEETLDDRAGGDAGGSGERPESQVVALLEQELQQTRDLLQATIEHSETSAEELKASNEELQALNEELRSATEELETSTEELQSVNEELVTVNSELKAKVDEAELVNDDLNNFIASTEIPMIFVDSDLCIRRYTPRSAGVFNILPGDVGRSLLDLTHRLDYPALGDDVARVVESLQSIERDVAGRDGRAFQARIKPYQTANRRVEGAVITLLDVTSLRDAEDRAARGDADMQVAMQRSSDFAVIAMDTNGVITGWNSGAQAIFGFTPEEIAGERAHILFVPEDREAGVPEQEFETARAEGRAEDNRWHLRKDGTRIFCSGVTTPVDVGGLRGYVKIARDITRQRQDDQARERQLEQARLRRATAEAAVALKDEFLAVMSHELKHPLNLINVSAEIVSRAAAQALQASPHAARAMDTLKHAVRTQGKIIDDLLDLSRVRTGKLALELLAVDMVAIAHAAVETAAADVAAAELDIRLEACKPSVLVNADAARLNQIVWNLLSNATKFTPAGGTITVRVSIENGCGRLDVADTGIGIDPAVVPRVFEMFGQVHSRATRMQTGLGIGLALVKQLVEHQGGRIEGHSEGAGKGARFSVWIPLYARALAMLPDIETVASRTDFSGLRILVVDDDPVTVESLQVLLEMEGAEVTATTGGRQALEALQRAPHDIVLTDLGMPEMDGYQLLSAIRERPEWTDLPVIALTGFGRSADVLKTGSAGFTGHIGKPVAIRELWQHIAAAVPRPARGR